jgi:hypothetical protein
MKSLIDRMLASHGYVLAPRADRMDGDDALMSFIVFMCVGFAFGIVSAGMIAMPLRLSPAILPPFIAVGVLIAYRLWSIFLKYEIK